MFQYLIVAGVILLIASIVLFIPGSILLVLGWLQKDAARKKAGLKMLAYAALGLLVSGTLCSSALMFTNTKL
jgi:predicted RND superfamily exporter protein